MGKILDSIFIGICKIFDLADKETREEKRKKFNKFKKYNQVELNFLALITSRETYFDILLYNLNQVIEENLWRGDNIK